MDAHEKISGTIMIRESKISDIPSYIQFQEGKEMNRDQVFPWLNKVYALGNNCEFILSDQLTDDIGYTHYKYQQTFNGYPIENAIIILHTFQDKVKSINGLAYTSAHINGSLSQSKNAARSAALDYVNADSYKWEIPVEETHIKSIEDDPTASYFPEGEVVYIQEFSDSPQLRLAYKFNIYAHEPISRAWIYVDAVTNKIIFEDKIIKHIDVSGTAITAYSGTRTITSDSYTGGYRLRETGRGNGIETYDMNQTTAFGSAVDFSDADNTWNNVNADLDEYATDAHWGAEMTYDYYFNQHNRNSIDGNGFALKSYVHYHNGQGAAFFNAFWNGNWMTYGDGNGSNISPLTTVDICGHEVTHGLTSLTAGLIYQGESGALNESFSDIFGTCIENYARPNNWNWTVGEDIGTIFRSMSNPNQANDPDTYEGNFWIQVDSSFDNGGVHINSGVQNHWFYLLTAGGTGTNDNNDAYAVTGIGITDASKIAFRNLTVYLTPSSNYYDARFYAMLSAIDLFGNCTIEVEATVDAWYAVGVGGPYAPTVISDFLADDTIFCSHPAPVNFSNLSVNGITYSWDFGDNTTSTAYIPSHIYNSFGSFDVTLVADGAACGNDSITLVGYVQVDTSFNCNINMPSEGVGVLQTSCEGTLYDSGGPNGSYSNFEDAEITIEPFGADSILLTFISFDVEPGSGATCNYDYVRIYDGGSTSAPLIGTYCNNNPPPASLHSSGDAITIEFHSDQGLVEPGFEISWQCFYAIIPPEADFEASDTISCGHDIQFTDLSTNGPLYWNWNFGDGSTSLAQNPTHTYLNNGTYSVKLVVSNAVGTDSITYTDLIVVDFVDAPLVETDTICENNPAELIAAANGDVRWYDSPTTNLLLHVGNIYNTPSLSGSTNFYASNYEPGSTFSVGPLSSAIGNGAYFNSYQYLIFDCAEDCVLKSVDVDAQGDGDRTIELRTSTGIILETRTVFVLDGIQTVDLDFNVPAGTDLVLGTGSGTSPSLYRNINGANFPYQTANDIVTITNSSAGTSYYYYFYNWKLEEMGCESPRVVVPVIALPDFVVNLILPEEACLQENQIQFAATMPGGTWSANCTNCIDPVSGVFQPSNAGEGLWSIAYTVIDNCEKTVYQDINVIDCLSTPEETNDGISIFPNPSQGLLYINIGNPNVVSVEINDIRGKIIGNRTVNTDQLSYDFTDFAKGVYFISFKNNFGQTIDVKKFIKN